MRLLTALLAVLVIAVPAMAAELPNFDKLWDYDHPEKTEQAFRALLPQARESGNRGYLVELLTQLARTYSLRRQFPESHKLLDEAESLLQPDLKRARVRYLLERGRAFNSARQPEKARPLFLEAWETARKASEDNLAIDAAHMMGIVEPPEQAITWDEKALKLAEETKDPAAKNWLGPLYNNLGWTYFDNKNPTKALELLRKALEFYENRGTPAQVRIARYSVGRVLRDFGRLSEALAMQRQAEKTDNEQDGYIFEEIGECLLAMKKQDEAKPYFARAYELLSKDKDLAGSEPKRLQRLKELGGKRSRRSL